MDSLCHPCITTTHVSYSVLSVEPWNSRHRLARYYWYIHHQASIMITFWKIIIEYHGYTCKYIHIINFHIIPIGTSVGEDVVNAVHLQKHLKKHHNEMNWPKNGCLLHLPSNLSILPFWTMVLGTKKPLEHTKTTIKTTIKTIIKTTIKPTIWP